MVSTLENRIDLKLFSHLPFQLSIKLEKKASVIRFHNIHHSFDSSTSIDHSLIEENAMLYIMQFVHY